MSNLIRGTIAELTGKFAVNGVIVTAGELSMLTRLGKGVYANKVGSVKTTTGRGKPSTIWEINPSAGLSFSAVPADAPVTAEVAETAEA